MSKQATKTSARAAPKEPKAPKVDLLQTSLQSALTLYVYARLKHIKGLEGDKSPIPADTQSYDNLALKEPAKVANWPIKLSPELGRMLFHLVSLALEELEQYKSDEECSTSKAFLKSMLENTTTLCWMYSVVKNDNRNIAVDVDQLGVLAIPKANMSLLLAKIKGIVPKEIATTASTIINRFTRILAYDIGGIYYNLGGKVTGKLFIGILRLYEDTTEIIKDLYQFVVEKKKKAAVVKKTVVAKTTNEEPAEDASADLSFSNSDDSASQ
jgi:hypothetical protein